jgi:hypothetical protein
MDYKQIVYIAIAFFGFIITITLAIIRNLSYVKMTKKNTNVFFFLFGLQLFLIVLCLLITTVFISNLLDEKIIYLQKYDDLNQKYTNLENNFTACGTVKNSLEKKINFEPVLGRTEKNFDESFQILYDQVTITVYKNLSVARNAAGEKVADVVDCYIEINIYKENKVKDPINKWPDTKTFFYKNVEYIINLSNHDANYSKYEISISRVI